MPTSTEDRLSLEAVQWTRMKLIEELDPISDRDFEVLAELREVLLKHGFENRFGVCLLHKHFEIGEDEIPVEESDEGRRISTIRVVKQGSVPDAWQTAWAFSRDIPDIRAGRNCRLECKGFGLTGHKRQHTCVGTT